MIVDDDAGTLESAALVLRSVGLHVHEAATATAALNIAHTHRLDLALIDNRLPDSTGLDIGRALRSQGISVPWILFSGFMTFDDAAEAGRLGALRAVGSPFDVEQVVLGALSKIARRRHGGWPEPQICARLKEPSSPAEECAFLILRARESQQDIRTIAEWARTVAKGYSTLRKLCYRVGIEPEAAHDFARLVRALAEAQGQVADLENHLRYGDDETLDTLLARSGLSAASTPEVVTFDDFLILQRFIRRDHPVLEALKSVFSQS